MAVKRNTEAAQVAPEAENAGNGTKKKARKPRTPSDFVWSSDLQAALAGILSSPKSAGSVRTPASVAAALTEQGYKGVTAQRVKSFVESTRERLQAKADKGEGKPPKDWFALDAARVKADPALFT